MNDDCYDVLVECAYDYLTKYDAKTLKSDMVSAIKEAQKVIDDESDEDEEEESEEE